MNTKYQTDEEQAAIKQLKAALLELRRAEVACDASGYGSPVSGPLADAISGAQNALDTMEGRN